MDGSYEESAYNFCVYYAMFGRMPKQCADRYTGADSNERSVGELDTGAC